MSCHLHVSFYLLGGCVTPRGLHSSAPIRCALVGLPLPPGFGDPIAWLFRPCRELRCVLGALPFPPIGWWGRTPDAHRHHAIRAVRVTSFRRRALTRAFSIPCWHWGLGHLIRSGSARFGAQCYLCTPCVMLVWNTGGVHTSWEAATFTFLHLPFSTCTCFYVSCYNISVILVLLYRAILGYTWCLYLYFTHGRQQSFVTILMHPTLCT